jgi:hypothetical protein
LAIWTGSRAIDPPGLAQYPEAQGEFQQAARWESGTSCSRIPSNRLLAGFPERDDRDSQQPSCS